MNDRSAQANGHSGPKGVSFDVAQLIADDLDATQRRRRRHFVPALVMSVLAIGGLLVAFGLRHDLLEQPPLQLGLQIAMFALCLLVLPAVGLGLLFPSKGTKVGLVVLTVAVAAAASLSWRVDAHHTDAIHFHVDHCFKLQLLLGLVLVGVAALSGAFMQRRRPSAVYWVATGLALAAMNTATWFCPMDSVEHVMPSHFAAATALVILAGFIGWWLHRRREVSASPAPE